MPSLRCAPESHLSRSPLSHRSDLLGLQTASSWVKLNAGQTGVYRVNYPSAQWQSLAVAAAQFSNGQATLSGPDVAGLLDDAFHLAQIGDADIGIFLNLTRYAAEHASASQQAVQSLPCM